MGSQAHALANKYNARRAAEGKTGMKWIVDDSGNLKLISIGRNVPHEPLPASKSERLI
ncbi:hypothetical protein ACIPPQ_20220 [Sphingopyxis sp. LARHCG72]